MSSCIDTILQRKSVRSYTSDPIPEAQKEKILEAMLRAPTAGNQMMYSVIQVEDQDVKDKLAESCDHQPFIAEAPWVLLFLADVQKLYDFFAVSGAEELVQAGTAKGAKPQEADLLLASCDALIAAHTAVMAAESLGIGSCYIGDILEHYEYHRDLLDLPRYAVPITMLTLGYPSEQQMRRPYTERIGMDKVVFQDTYRRLDEEELLHLYDHNIGRYGSLLSGTKNFGQHTYLRKFSSDFMWEMRRSIKSMLRNWE